MTLTPSTRRSVAPCVHPRCEDHDGNARLVTAALCDGCQRHLLRQLDWLAGDYATLKSQLLKPSTGAGVRTSRTEFGHPAEWASDTARAIAEGLARLEDAARAVLGDRPRPYAAKGSAYRPAAPEQRVLADAHVYLRSHLEVLATSEHEHARKVTAELAALVHEQHGRIRAALGYSRQVQQLPGLRCPSCDVAALTRSVGQVDCEACGRVIPEKLYPLLTRIVVDESLDELIDAYDAAHAASEDEPADHEEQP